MLSTVPKLIFITLPDRLYTERISWHITTWHGLGVGVIYAWCEYWRERRICQQNFCAVLFSNCRITCSAHQEIKPCSSPVIKRGTRSLSYVVNWPRSVDVIFIYKYEGQFQKKKKNLYSVVDISVIQLVTTERSFPLGFLCGSIHPTLIVTWFINNKSDIDKTWRRESE